jgi:hypothetical protein
LLSKGKTSGSSGAAVMGTLTPFRQGRPTVGASNWPSINRSITKRHVETDARSAMQLGQRRCGFHGLSLIF